MHPQDDDYQYYVEEITKLAQSAKEVIDNPTDYNGGFAELRKSLLDGIIEVFECDYHTADEIFNDVMEVALNMR